MDQKIIDRLYLQGQEGFRLIEDAAAAGVGYAAAASDKETLAVAQKVQAIIDKAHAEVGDLVAPHTKIGGGK